MTNRITQKDLEQAVKHLNERKGYATEYATKLADDKYITNINHYHLDYAYSGVKLVQTMSQGGGIRTISTGGYGTKRELYNFIQGMFFTMTRPYKEIHEYILDNIDNSGYEGCTYYKVFNTDKDKLQFLYDTFNSEYGWHIAQVGQLKALASWLAGLPSAVSIEWRNHAILELGLEWGLLDYETTGKWAESNNERMEDAFLERWFMFMAMRIKELWRINGVGQ